MKNQYTILPPEKKSLSYLVSNTQEAEFPETFGKFHLHYSGVPFYARSPRHRTFYDYTKRCIDISFAGLMLVFLFPLMAVIFLLIKATSPGPAFFRHKRLGYNGKEFDCIKFRTMVADAEEKLKNDKQIKEMFQKNYKIENDPRITPLGKFLRQTSLDELPQLIQVFQGKMSLIGPRPIVPDELAKYAIYGKKLLSVKPGLSGLWQTSGRSSTTYSERVLLDMLYIDQRSLFLDFQLLFLTVFAVIRKNGAC